MPHRALKPPPRLPVALPKRAKAAPPAPPWPSYTGVSQFVGTSPSAAVSVWVDPTLGAPALQNAQDLVADADRVVNLNNAIFGSSGGPVDVIVFALGGATDGTGGADHMGCDYASGGQIEVCASFGQSMRVSALFEAELSECAMQNNLCGESTGEALSRWCASAVSGNALSDFATAPTWQADSQPNFVDQVDPTDQNPDSTGCGMAFLSWVQSLGYSLSQIAQAMVSGGDGAPLSAMYSTLTDDDAANAWPKFQAAVASLGTPIATDDPFGSNVTPQPAPAPPGPPPPAPAPGATSLTLDQAQAALAAGWPIGSGG